MHQPAHRKKGGAVGFRRIYSRSSGINEGVLAQKILRLYFTEVERCSQRLSDDEWEGLLRALREESAVETRNKIIIAALRWALRTAHQYTGRGLPLLDLIQEANLGLFDAVEAFDVGRGAKFVTYADRVIRGRVLRAIFVHSTTVRRPHFSRTAEVKRFVNEFRRRFGQDPLPWDVAEGLGVSKQRMVGMMERVDTGKDLPSDDLSQDEEERSPNPLEEAASVMAGLPPDTMVLAKDEFSAIRRKVVQIFTSAAWRCLRSRDREIIFLHYGMNGTAYPLPCTDIAERFPLSPGRVWAIIQGFWKGLSDIPGENAKQREQWFRSQLERMRAIAEYTGEQITWEF